MGHNVVVSGVMTGQPSAEYPGVAIAGQPRMYGEQKSPSKGEDKERAEGAEARRHARADGSLEAGGSQGEAQEHVNRPDD